MKNKTKILTKRIIISIAIALTISLGIFVPALKHAFAYEAQITLTNADFESELLTAGWVVSGETKNVTLEKTTEVSHGGNAALIISHNEETNYGAKTSYTTKLEANKYYILSVWAKTTDASTKFSYGISGGINEEITITPTSTDWQQYKLYIETNSTTDANVAIELWLGSKSGTLSSGTVYFDDVNLTNIDRAQYNKAKADGKNTISKNDIYQSATDSIKLINGDESLKWSFSIADGETSETQSAVPTSYTFNEGTDIEYTTKVVFAKNTSTTKSLTLKSSNFELQKLSLYRVSILVKAETDTAKFDLKITNGASTKTQTISSLSKTTTNNTFNNFTEYVFFVRTAATTENFKLSIVVNSSSSIYIDNPKVENSTYTDFKAATTAKKFDLTGSASIENGYFNQTENNNENPRTAISWETFGTATMGIIAPDDQHYTLNGVSMPIPTCYKISSVSQTYAGINSSGISIKTSSPIAKISVWVKTENGANAIIKLYQSSNLVAQSKSVSSESEWKQISFYIKAGNALTLNLQLALGESDSNTSSGAVYFYAATLSTTDNEDVFFDQKAKNNANEYFWDDSSYFSHNGITKNGVYQLLAASYKIETEQADSFAGALDLEQIDESSVFFAQKANLKNPSNEYKNEYLALYLAGNGSIKATRLAGDTTKLTGYVKLQTKVKVLGDGSNVEIIFGDLATFNVPADNQWHTIEIYIKSGSKTINTIDPEYTLSSDNNTSAIALFDEVKFSQSNEITYKSKTTSETIKKADITSSSSEEKNSSKTKTTSSTNWATIFFIALSSALLVGAVLIAVIARAVKRLPKRTIINIPNSGYGKNKKNGKTK